MSPLATLFLIGLLVAPALALHRLSGAVDGWLLVGAATAVSMIAYALYAVDKRRAQSGAWRIPEFWLHLVEAAGGWPGAWLAQVRVRHKNRKVSYQVVFWLIVAAHQFVAIDYLRDGSLSGAIGEVLLASGK